MKYIFILGRSPKLSVQELNAVFCDYPQGGFTDQYAIFKMSQLNCQAALKRLGGTVKIGRYIGKGISAEKIASCLMRQHKENNLQQGSVSSSKKIVFGMSIYGPEKRRYKTALIHHLSLQIKRILQKQGFSVRFLPSSNAILSSVDIVKNRCQEIIIAKGELFATCAVQEFEDYSRRDYGRPFRDPKSGMLPPKLAKMMINLSRISPDDVLLDPFCGSGTIVHEALLLGQKKVIGSDISPEAVRNARENTRWILEQYSLKPTFVKFLEIDARKISQQVKKVDAIVTEPYLGPPLRGRESLKELENILKELSELYRASLREFAKVLKPGGRLVIVFPLFRYRDSFFSIDDYGWKHPSHFFDETPDDLIFVRPGQRVGRSIKIFVKKGT